MSSHRLCQVRGTRRRPAVVAVVVLAVMASAGCGGGGGTDGENEEAAPTVTSSGAGPAASQPAPAPPAVPQSEIPAVTVLDVASGGEFALGSLVPSDRPLLVWFWAPH